MLETLGRCKAANHARQSKFSISHRWPRKVSPFGCCCILRLRKFEKNVRLHRSNKGFQTSVAVASHRFFSHVNDVVDHEVTGKDGKSRCLVLSKALAPSNTEQDDKRWNPEPFWFHCIAYCATFPGPPHSCAAHADALCWGSCRNRRPGPTSHAT